MTAKRTPADIEKRKYTRVHFRGDIGEAYRILGARIVWPNQEVSDVFDLSFKGFAVSRPALVDLKPGALQSIRVELGERHGFLVPVRVVWIKEQLVGLEIGDVSAEAHLELNFFLTDKIVGQNMRPVDRQFFNGHETFQFWFQGPKGTHLFIWTDSDDPTKVTKVSLDMDGDVWEFENRRVIKGDRFNDRAMQILGQITVTEFRLKDVIEKVAAST